MTKDTVGKHARDLMLKAPDSRDPIEIEREMHQDYEKNIYECIETHKKLFDVPRGEWFYVNVLTKRERLMQNVLRHYFFCTRACPTPSWDQAVYAYDPWEDRIDFLWVIPSKDTCEYLVQNSLAVADSERELLRFVLEFADGTLLKICKKLNGEAADSILLAS